LDWQFKTTPQEGANKRVSIWPRGKMLGGERGGEDAD